MGNIIDEDRLLGHEKSQSCLSGRGRRAPREAAREAGAGLGAGDGRESFVSKKAGPETSARWGTNGEIGISWRPRELLVIALLKQARFISLRSASATGERLRVGSFGSNLREDLEEQHLQAGDLLAS